MFNVTEFRQLRKYAPDKLNGMISELGITPPRWETEDECKLAARLDDAITEELSRRLKSESVISGYINLLSIGNVPFRYSETDSNLLSKIVRNKDEIRREITKEKRERKAKEVAKTKCDFSHVPCNLWKKESKEQLSKRIRKAWKNLTGKSSVDIEVFDSPIFADKELIDRIRDTICEYWQEHKDTDIRSIDVVLERCSRKPSSVRQDFPAKVPHGDTTPVFSEAEINNVLEVLQIVNDVVEKIKGGYNV